MKIKKSTKALAAAASLAMMATVGLVRPAAAPTAAKPMLTASRSSVLHLSSAALRSKLRK